MEKTFSTKLNKNAVAVETKSKIDFTGVSQVDMEKLAGASVVILQQAIYRISGKIPATDTIKVAELLKNPRPQFVATPENMAARVNSLNEEGYRKALSELKLPDKTVELMVANKFHQE